MRRWLTLVGCALVAVSAPAAATLASEVGAAVETIGWWTRSPVQQAPEDGIAVASAPDGPVTVAAVVIDTGPAGVLGATLELVEAGGAGAVASVRACGAAAGWEPVQGGDLADAPAADCDAGSVRLERDDEGTWRGELGPLVIGRQGPVAIALLPGEIEEGAPALAFDVQMARPTLTSVRSSGGEPNPAPGSEPADDAHPDTPAGAALSLPSTAAPTPRLAPVLADAPQDAAPSNVPEVAAPVERRVALGAFSTGGQRPWSRALLFVILAAAAGGAAGLARRSLT